MRLTNRTEAETRLRAVLGRDGENALPRSLLDSAPLDSAPIDSAPLDSAPLNSPLGSPPVDSAVSRLALLPSLPSALRAGVLDPKRRGALALCALAVAAAVTAGALALRARPRASVVQRPSARVVSVAATAAPSAVPTVVVDVAGDVQHPGLQRLPAGSRVADAVAAAGGVKRGASTSTLNLARKLIDGEQILVGAGHAAPAAAGGAARAAGQPLDLNAATLPELDQLSGVGPVLAQRIITWRTEHGGFTTVDQLREVEGIGDRKFASLRAHVTL